MDCAESVKESVLSVKMVALDFDLTIYDYADPEQTLVLVGILDRLADEGVRIGLASGREFGDLQRTLEKISFAWSPKFPAFAICQEGYILNWDGEEIPSAREWNRGRRERIEEVNSELRPVFETHIQLAVDKGLVCIEELVVSDVGLNVVFETPEMAAQVCHDIQQATAHRGDVEISRNHHIVIGLPQGLNKGYALAKLADIYGLQGHEVLAIGDNLNDLCMLSGLHGFKAATVKNAEPKVLDVVAAQSGFIAGERCALGVLEILERCFSGYSTGKSSR